MWNSDHEIGSDTLFDDFNPKDLENLVEDIFQETYCTR